MIIVIKHKTMFTIAQSLLLALLSDQFKFTFTKFRRNLCHWSAFLLSYHLCVPVISDSSLLFRHSHHTSLPLALLAVFIHHASELLIHPCLHEPLSIEVPLNYWGKLTKSTSVPKKQRRLHTEWRASSCVMTGNSLILEPLTLLFQRYEQNRQMFADLLRYFVWWMMNVGSELCRRASGPTAAVSWPDSSSLEFHSSFNCEFICFHHW